ncbi:MAG: ATP-binding cassette domain-containing protein [Ignavibacteriae bacterium]|nr:ATP-binding cassette domain-containing protein [Ignavibacteriota bacterium]
MDTINVQNLTKIYRSHVRQEGLKNSIRSLFHREYKEYIAVNNVSFSIAEGELVGMLGANGAGKTTILKMLSGLLTPTSGTATVMNYIPWQRKNDFRKNFLIVMGQRNQLWWDLPAADSFLLNKEIYGIPQDMFLKRRDMLAERLDVADKLHVQVRRLSLGERMKCELIAALLHSPKVIFLDEPTIGLDVVAQHALREFIADFNKESATTIILTSHYMDDIERLCKRVMIIDNGKLMFDGALSSLVEQFAAEKMLTIKFTEKVERHELEAMGIITDYAAEQASLRIPRAKIAAVAGECLGRFQVADITIEEVPIEDIIRQIFSRE